MTTAFVNNYFDKFVNDSVFLEMLESICTVPRYIPVGVGITRDQFPRSIKVRHILLYFYLKVFLSDPFTCPILRPLVPLFRISSDVSSGFQSQSRVQR